jgi:predicted nucleic acid-binding protein
MVLVDSSIWIEASRRDGDLGAKVALEALLEEYEAATTNPVLLEVLGGARKEERKRMSDYFAIIPHIQADANDWEKAISFVWLLRDQGIAAPWNDILIATIALRRDIRVFARDKHFDAMANMMGLTLYRPGLGGTYSPENRGGEGI